VQPGEVYTYPLSVLANLGYKSTVTLTATPSPAPAGFKASFDPATLEVAAERARGPGSLAVEIVDALYGLDQDTLRQRGRVT
jgi:hydroxyethylthiazole kinase-like sugar kinase family protein